MKKKIVLLALLVLGELALQLLSILSILRVKFIVASILLSNLTLRVIQW